MRLVMDLDEKYKNLFLEVAKAAKATVIIQEPDFWTELPEEVKAGVEESLKQAESGQTKSFEEVKKILATDEFKDHFY